MDSRRALVQRRWMATKLFAAAAALTITAGVRTHLALAVALVLVLLFRPQGILGRRGT